MPTTEMIGAQALELATNMRTLAAQSTEEATRLSNYADSVANSIVDAVTRFTTQTSTLLTFIDRTTESCQVAIDSINVFGNAAKGELPPPNPTLPLPQEAPRMPGRLPGAPR
jgi:hypothetical protein